jgi:hypothetical protein
LNNLGELKELAARLPCLTQEALSKGNTYAYSNHQSFGGYLLFLTSDQPQLAAADLHELESRSSRRGFHVQHMNIFEGMVQTQLYLGNAQAAWNKSVEHAHALKRSLLMRAELVRIFTYHNLGRASLLMARSGQDRARFRRRAKQYARRLRKEQCDWARPIETLLHAAVASLDGDRDAAIAQLTAAIEGFQGCNMALYAAAARLIRGKLMGRAGRIEADAGSEWMAGQGIKNPERMAQTLVPGIC